MLNGSRTKAAPPASRRLALPPRHRRLPRPRPCRSKRHRLLRRQALRASCSDSKTTCSESIERSRRSHARLAAVPMRRGTRNCQRSNSSSGRSRTSKGRSEHSRDRVTRRGWILFVAMALIWGIPYLFIKIAVTELSPASLVLFRTAIGTVLLLPLAAARKDLVPVMRQWRWILVDRKSTRLNSSHSQISYAVFCLKKKKKKKLTLSVITKKNKLDWTDTLIH